MPLRLTRLRAGAYALSIGSPKPQTKVTLLSVHAYSITVGGLLKWQEYATTVQPPRGLVVYHQGVEFHNLSNMAIEIKVEIYILSE